jgi:hypothetical protein
MVVNPWGEVLATSRSAPAIVYQLIDYGLLDSLRWVPCDTLAPFWVPEACVLRQCDSSSQIPITKQARSDLYRLVWIGPYDVLDMDEEKRPGCTGSVDSDSDSGVP